MWCAPSSADEKFSLLVIEKDIGAVSVQKHQPPTEDMVPLDFADRVAATAVVAARRAGEIQMQAFRNKRVQCTRLLHDVRLETDRRCEETIVEVIRRSFPEHAILSEESGLLPGGDEYLWIVDPLDGTVNFWHGIPFFCVSVACYHVGPIRPDRDISLLVSFERPVAGVVYLPYHLDLFVGTPERGAFLNDRPISVSPAEHPRDLVVSVSFGKTPEMMQCMTQRLERLLPQVRKARCLGAAAAELSYAAAGFLGGVVYEGIKPWDFAAAKVLVEAAGGFLEAKETQPDQWRVWAGAPGVRSLLEALMSD